MDEKEKAELMKKSRTEVAKILQKTKESSNVLILKRASKLTALERLKLIDYFQIEPRQLASKIIFFWLTIRTSHAATTTAGNISSFLAAHGEQG